MIVSQKEKLSEIEPDNEVCINCGSTNNLEVICGECASLLPSFKERQLNKEVNEKPYLFYEGEKYYFGEEYEFSDGIDLTHINKLFSSDLEDGKMFMNGYSHIRKIDHKAK